MPKTTNSKKKPTAKVGGGGVGTKVSKLNLKIVIPIIVLVAALGGFYIFQKSSASAGYTFIRYADGMTGGTAQKVDGVSYRMLQDRPSTLITAAEMKNSKQICAHWKTMGSAPWGRIKIEVKSSTGSYISSNWVDWSNSSTSGNVCTPVNSSSAGGASVQWINMAGTKTPKIGIDTIYGKP